MASWLRFFGIRNTFAVVSVAAAFTSTMACTQNRAAYEDGSSGGDPSAFGGPCTYGGEGCPCTTEGDTQACGMVKETSGDFVTCSQGHRTCKSGAWGACIGETIVVKNVSNLTSGIHGLGLGGKTACANACDPYCTQFLDTPQGIPLPADGGLVVTDAGLTLKGEAPTSVPCTGLSISPSPSTNLVVSAGVAPPSPGTVAFTATLSPAACYAGGNAPALWSVDKFDIAQIGDTGNFTLVTPIAGSIQVKAFAGNLSAQSTVNVTVNMVDVSAIPANTTAANYTTTGGTADSTLEVIYPYANTLFPLGLQPPLVMWRDTLGTAASSVKLTLRYPASGTPIFQWSEITKESDTAPTPTLAAKPRGTIPPEVWFAFEQTVARNSATLGDTAEIGIQRRIGTTTPRAEVVQPIRFANGQLKGKILYNSYGTNLVQNYGNTRWGTRFGAATLMIPPNGTQPTVVSGFNSATNGTGCRVCHSVSANGEALITNRYEPNTKTTSLVTPNTTPIVESLIGASTGDGRFSWPALSPDGTYLFANGGPLEGSYLSASRLYAVPSGNLITAGAIPSTLRAATPAFAHDASAVVFNFNAGTPAPLTNPTTGPTTGDGKSISIMSYNNTTKTFSNFRNLYTPTSVTNNTGTSSFPSFLPPSENGVVFHRERRYNGRDFGGTRSDSDTTGAANSIGTTAELWWVNTTGTPNAVRLDKMNGWSGGSSYLPKAGNLHGSPVDAVYDDPYYNYEPTVLPQKAGGYSWVVFTSRRLYGNVATINPYWSDPRYQYINAEPTTKKLWVGAINSSPTAGADPSNPPFYLPGQELLAGNSRGYFVLEQCKQPGNGAANVCDTTADCCQSPTASVCQLDPPPITNPPVRHCQAASTAVCKAENESCTADSQCCAFPSGGKCASGICTQPPPIAVYSPASYVRTFTAACVTGTTLAWRYMEWQSTTPTGTSVNFTGRTKSATGSFSPSVAIGTAQGASILPPNWGRGTTTVEAALKAAGSKSQEILEVTMAFNPSSSPSAAPTLIDWRVSYDCVPSE